ncbi:MAG: N-acetylmuramoyl-L-alanine amidase [Candidatus Sumerlaeia bacterium]|nr:N-acetylmuramoyl-L-alanine amidase [Candidatus Sumerlaeia bacterium]
MMIKSALTRAITSISLFSLVALAPLTILADQEEAPVEATLKITESPLPDNCYTAIEGEREIDTVVVHYASAINWFNAGFQNILSDEGKEYAESIGLTRENIHDHKYDWKLVKYIFESYKVSAHYAIGRDGEIVRFVDDNDRAWHAGPSKMPNDGRERVNNFSIGIELMSSHPDDDKTVVTHEDAYTEEQYTSLKKLIAHLCSLHDIKYVVGHDEIAPGRKTDPGPLFLWERVRNEDYSPVDCD